MGEWVDNKMNKMEIEIEKLEEENERLGALCRKQADQIDSMVTQMENDKEAIRKGILKMITGRNHA